MDIILNRNENLKMKSSKSNYEDGDNAEIEMDDRNFIDMVTSKLNS